MRYVDSKILKVFAFVIYAAFLAAATEPSALAEVTCPAEYVKVPPVAPYTTASFCVAKYEAKNVSAYISTAEFGKMIAYGLSLNDAIAACKSGGTSYDIMTNNEWQAIAQLIAANPANIAKSMVSSYHQTVPAGGVCEGNSNYYVDYFSYRTDLLQNACKGDMIVGVPPNTTTAKYPPCTTTSTDLRRRNLFLNDDMVWDLSGNFEELVNTQSPANFIPQTGMPTTWSSGYLNFTALKTNTQLFTLGTITGTLNTLFGNPNSSITPNLFAKIVAPFSTLKDGAVITRGSQTIFDAKFYNITKTDRTPNSVGFRCVFREDPDSPPPTPTLSVQGDITVNGIQITKSNTVTASISGIDPANQMYITDDPTCTTGGTWETAATTTSVTLKKLNSANTLYIKARKANTTAESKCSTGTSITHDTTPPSTPSSILLVQGATTTRTPTPSNVTTPTLRIGNLTVGDSVSIHTDPACTDATKKGTSKIASGTTVDIPVTPALTAYPLPPITPITFYAKSWDVLNNTSTCSGVLLTYLLDTKKPGSPAIKINNGAATTNTLTVPLAISASDPDTNSLKMYITNTADCGGWNSEYTWMWGPYSPIITAWTLAATGTTNEKRVWLMLKDGAGNYSDCVSSSISFNTTPPDAPNDITISSPTTATTTTPVTSMTANTASPKIKVNKTLSGHKYSLHNKEKCVDTALATETASSTSVELTAPTLGQDGPASYFVKATNPYNNSTCSTTKITYTYDKTPPIPQTFQINGGAPTTNKDTIDLTISALGDPVSMKINTTTCEGGTWIPYATTYKAWPIPESERNKNYLLTIQYKDVAGNISACKNASITHKNTKPSAPTAVTASTFATSTSPTSVVSNILKPSFAVTVPLAVDDTLELFTSSTCDSTSLYSSYKSTATTSVIKVGINRDLPANNKNQIFAKVTDVVGNTSGCTNTGFTYETDTLAPSGTLELAGGNPTTKTPDIAIKTSAINDPNQILLVNADNCNNAAESAWKTYNPATPPTTWNLGPTPKMISVSAQYRDKAGNKSDCITKSIRYSDMKPTKLGGPKVVSGTTKISKTSSNNRRPVIVTEIPSTYSPVTTASAHGRNPQFTTKALTSDQMIVSIHTDSLCQSAPVATTIPKTLAAGTDESLTLNSLTEDKTYNFYTKLTDLSGNYSCSDANLEYTLDTTPPSSPSISINDGKDYTTTDMVSLALSASDSPKDMLISNDSNCTGNWQNYSTKIDSWKLKQTNQIATVYAKFKDAAGNETACIPDTITHDNIAPIQPSLAIKSPTSSKSNVTQPTITVSNVEVGNTIALYNSSTCNEAQKTASVLATTTSIDLKTSPLIAPTGTSTFHFYAKATDPAGNSTCSSSKATYTLNTTPPIPGTISINGGKTVVNNPTVTLTFNASDDAKFMYIAKTAQDCALDPGTKWEDYAITKKWTLTPVNESADVFAKFKNDFGNSSACIKATIRVDNTPPQVPTIALANPAQSRSKNTTPKFIIGNVTAGDTITLHNEPDCPDNNIKGTAVAAGSTVEITSSPRTGEGTRHFSAKATDEAGNSTCSTSTAKHTLDLTAPQEGKISINNGDSFTNSMNVKLTLFATDPTSPTKVLVSNTSLCDDSQLDAIAADTHWQNITPNQDNSIQWTLGQPNTRTTVYARFQDIAGNISPCVSANIRHKSTPPTEPTLSLDTPATSLSSNLAPIISITGVDAGNQVTLHSDNTCTAKNIISATNPTPYTATNSTTPLKIQTKQLTANAKTTIYALVTNEAKNSLCSKQSITYETDTNPPTQANLTLTDSTNTDYGKSWTNKTTITLTPFVKDATKMFLTKTKAECDQAKGSDTSGWEAYTTNRNWTINSSETNAPVTVYAKYKDNAGNTTDCVSAKIIHDDKKPTFSSAQITSPTLLVDNAGNNPTPTITVSGIEKSGTIDPMRVSLHQTSGCNDDPPLASALTTSDSADLTTSTLPKDGSYSFYVRVKDPAGNMNCSSTPLTYKLDRKVPVLNSVTITNNRTVEDKTYVITNTVDIALDVNATGKQPQQMYITSQTNCFQDINLNQIQWEAFKTTKTDIEVKNLNQENALYAQVRDAIGNLSECKSVKFTHTNAQPSQPGISRKSPSNEISNVKNPVFTISNIKANDTIEYYDNGRCTGTAISKRAPISTSSTVGTAEFSPALTLDKVYTFFVKVTNIFGNSVCSTTSENYTLDTTSPPGASNFIIKDGDIEVTSSVETTHTKVKIIFDITGDSSEYAVFPNDSCRSNPPAPVTWETIASGLKTVVKENQDIGIAENTTKAIPTSLSILLRDKAGNLSSCLSKSFTYNNMPPALPTLSYVNPKQGLTNNTKPTLGLSAVVANVTYALYSDSTCTKSLATSLTPPISNPYMSLQLAQELSTDPVKTVDNSIYIKATDKRLRSACSPTPLKYTLDITKPIDPTFKISSTIALDQEYKFEVTKVPDVTLTIKPPSDATEMYITNTKDCISGGSWEAIATTKPWTLKDTTTTATNTVYLQVRDAALNYSNCVQQSILFNNIPPTTQGLTMTLGPNTTSPTNTNLTPKFTVKGGGVAPDIRVSLHTDKATCELNTRRGFALSTGTSVDVPLEAALPNKSGTYTYYAKLRDKAGNYSPCSDASITYVVDIDAPSGTVKINDDAPITTSTLGKLTFNFTGAPSDYAIFTNNNCSGTPNWNPIPATGATFNKTDVPLGIPETTTQVLTPTIGVLYKDTAGNISGCATDSITYDNRPPALPDLSYNNPTKEITNNTKPTLNLSSVSAGFTYTLHSAAGCSSIPLATLTPTETRSTTPVTLINALPINTSTTVYIKVTNIMGRTACSPSGLKYTIDTTSPTKPSFILVDPNPKIKDQEETYLTGDKVNIVISNIPADAQEMCYNNSGDPCKDSEWKTITGRPGATISSWPVNTPTTQEIKKVFLQYRDAAGNTSQIASDTITLLNTLPNLVSPTLTLTSASKTPRPSFTFDNKNSNTGPLTIFLHVDSNTCTTASIIGSAPYSGSSSIKILPVKDLTKGLHTIYTSMRDSAGNSQCMPTVTTTYNYTLNYTVTSTKPALNLIKAPPSSPQLSIANGATATKTSSVTLNLSAENKPTEMYITDFAGCTTGGDWEPYSATKSWKLRQSNGNATVYAKYRNAGLNESDCVSDSILHDSIAPDAPSFVNDGTSSSSSSTPMITWGQSKDLESGISFYEYAIGTTNSGAETLSWTKTEGNQFAQKNHLNLKTGTTYFASVRATDHAGNTSKATSGDGWTVQTSTPSGSASGSEDQDHASSTPHIASVSCAGAENSGKDFCTFTKPGTYSITITGAGKLTTKAWGAGAKDDGNGDFASAEFEVNSETLTLTIGAGGTDSSSGSSSAQGGSSELSRGDTPLLTAAGGGTAQGATDSPHSSYDSTGSGLIIQADQLPGGSIDSDWGGSAGLSGHASSEKNCPDCSQSGQPGRIVIRW